MSSDLHADIVARLTDAQTVALTLYGEARGERVEGRIAVANVIRNRVRHQRPSWGFTPKQVCLKFKQFSCWLPEGGRANYDLVMDAALELVSGRYGGPMLRECVWIADGALTERFADTVHGATHYFAPRAMVPAGKVPAWAEGREPVAAVGNHLFFSGVM